MATNITVYDLLRYPDNSKTVTVDLKTVVPYGRSGDEKWVLSAVTSATASGSASIQDAFVDYTNVGWCKSSGIPTGPFTITSSTCNLRVAIDEAASSASTISLFPTDTAVSGDDVAEMIQKKISELSMIDAAKEGNLSYLNSKCYYEDGRFVITSGGMSSSFTGSNRSSVQVLAGLTNDASALLGFDIPLESVTLASQAMKHTYVTAPVVASATIPVNSVSGFSIGDCIALKTAAGDTYYRYLDNVVAPNFTANATVTVPSGTLIQLLRVQDPDGVPASYYNDVDSPLRHVIDLLVNQINFAS